MIEQYRTALVKKDTAALERIWADDYTFINASGAVVTKAMVSRLVAPDFRLARRSDVEFAEAFEVLCASKLPSAV